MSDVNDEAVLLSRRTMMAGGVAGAALAALGSTPALANPGAIGIPDSASARAAIVRRMRYRTDAGMLMWWFRGRMYGQQGATLIPLCGMVFGSMIKLAPRDDGGFEVSQYELGFRTDLVTGEKIDRLRNPVTGEMIDIPFAPVGPTSMRYSTENIPEVPETLGGSRFNYTHSPEEFWTADKTLYMQYHARSVVETPGKPDRVINDLGMLYGPLADALNPAVKSVKARIQGTDVTDYARWLKMPAGAGSQTLRSIGAKVHRFEDMPRDWIAMVAQSDPRMAKDPLSVFDRAEATYKG
jgi:hypothetical protein